MENIINFTKENCTNPSLKSSLKKLDYYDTIFEITNFLEKHYEDIVWYQRIYHIINGIHHIVLCEICKSNPAKYSRRWGYVCCSKKCTSTSISIKSKKSHDDGLIEKLVKKNRKKYGKDFYFQTNEFKEERSKIMIEKYGTDITLESPELKNKFINTCRSKYGVDHISKSDMVKNINKNKFIKNLHGDYRLLSYDKDFKLHHKICNNNFSIARNLFKTRKRYGFIFCTVCNPIQKGFSQKEKDLLRHIKKIYGDTIIENSRKIISPYELDIYLPKLNLAVEFNGDYWHSFPKTIKKDIIKENMCKEKCINLIVVWESEWNKNKILVVDRIKNRITMLLQKY